MALFAYNRSTYMFDASMRFERFNSAREFACAQTGMYRRDIRKLTELTTTKMKLWSVSASLCMALCIALYCAGRLGLHGPSPPGWIMGLWLTNNAAAFVFMGLTIWLSIHCSFRAQVAAVHLLTRKVRMPVPTLKQLDRARRLASEFEQQNLSSILRVPFLMGTGSGPAGAAPPGEPEPAAPPSRSQRRSSSLPPKRSKQEKAFRAAPSWVRDEWETDRAGMVVGPAAPDVADEDEEPIDMPPEHFRLYAQAQKEWWAYDVYARVAMLYGFLSFIHGLAYYGIGHINIELRAFWAPYAVCLVLMVLHASVMKFDIRQKTGTQYLPYCEWLGPFAVLPAAIAMSLDFRVEFNKGAIILCYILQFLSYGLQTAYTVRLLELVLPEGVRIDQKLGWPWWPESWAVPEAFQHVLYLVAPPHRLMPGQHDLVREVKKGDRGVFREHQGSDQSAQGTAGGTFGAVSSAPCAPVAPSATTPADRMTKDELVQLVKDLDRLFEWAISDEIFCNHMSGASQQKVRNLYSKFTAVRRGDGEKRSAIDLATVCNECMEGLRSVLGHEGLSARKDEWKPEPVASLGMHGPAYLKMQHIIPWRLVAAILVAMLVSWSFMILGTFIEVFVGEQGFVTAPHWSRPPMTRESLEPHELGTPLGFPWAAGAKPYIVEQMVWHEEKRGGHVFHIGKASGFAKDAHKRRLATSPVSPLTENLQGLLRALPTVKGVPQFLQEAPTDADPAAIAAMPLAPAVPVKVQWPGFFEPKLLACGSLEGIGRGGGLVAAIATRGFGAVARVGHGNAPVAETFRLDGLTELPPLAGVSWGPREELLLISRAGHFLECPGPRPPAGGRWACAPAEGVPKELPLGDGGRLAAAAAAWVRDGGGSLRLHAAFVDERAPDVVAIFVARGSGASHSWTPLGEMPAPNGDSPKSKISLSFVDNSDLLVTTESGVTLRRSLVDGRLISRAAHTHGGAWQSTCGFHGAAGSNFAHLYLRRVASSARAWTPEVVTVESGNSAAQQ